MTVSAVTTVFFGRHTYFVKWQWESFVINWQCGISIKPAIHATPCYARADILLALLQSPSGGGGNRRAKPLPPSEDALALRSVERAAPLKIVRETKTTSMTGYQLRRNGLPHRRTVHKPPATSPFLFLPFSSWRPALAVMTSGRRELAPATLSCFVILLHQKSCSGLTSAFVFTILFLPGDLAQSCTIGLDADGLPPYELSSRPWLGYLH